MKGASTLLITLFPTVLLASAQVHAGGIELSIDLSADKEGIRIVRQLRLRGETSISLQLRRADPDAEYDLLVRIDEAEIPPIVLGSLKPATGVSGNSILDVIESSVDTAGEQYEDSDEEGGEVHEVWPRIDRSDEDESRSTIRVADVATLRPGQSLDVTVRRRAGAGGSEGVWRYAFTTGAQGRWTISLGFGLSLLLDGDREYFTRSDSNEFYTIAEEKSDDIIHPIPAIFFHWLPRDDELAPWSWSLTAGLGYDFRTAVIFAGGSVTYHRNITFAIGAVVHQVNRLNRRYRLGDMLLEDLDPDQLVDERYAINPFFGVSFRLSEKLLE